MKILLSTLPSEGQAVNWTTPTALDTATANPVMPLGILSLASNLPAGHEVVVLDPASRGWGVERTVDVIEREAPDVLGLSVVTHKAWAMVEVLRRTTTPYKAVGGPHATPERATLILRQGADAVFVGMLADREFAEAMRTKQTGTIHCKTGINEIKFPNRNLIDISYYYPRTFPLFKTRRRLSMFSSIGCPHRCIYCNVQTKHVQLKYYRDVLSEMRHLRDIVFPVVGCQSIHIQDDNFNLNRAHLERVLTGLEDGGNGLEWSARGQTKMDLSLVGRLSVTGFKRIHVGFEALDDTILSYYRKGITVRDIERFCEVMHDNNIDVLAYFILGSYHDSPAYWKVLPRRIKDLGIKYPFFNILFPEIDSAYYRSLLLDGTYKRDYWVEQIHNPRPYFSLPYPYGEARQREVQAYAKEML